MAHIEVGKEYKNGRNAAICIVAEARNLEVGYTYYLGVRKDTRLMVGMECFYYTESGRIAIGGTHLDDLRVPGTSTEGQNTSGFDWRSLKEDDVIHFTKRSGTFTRHVHSIDLDREVVYYYSDGVDSSTYDSRYHEISSCIAHHVRSGRA